MLLLPIDAKVTPFVAPVQTLTIFASMKALVIGAKPMSKVLYTRMKGEIDNAVAAAP